MNRRMFLKSSLAAIAVPTGFLIVPCAKAIEVPDKVFWIKEIALEFGSVRYPNAPDYSIPVFSRNGNSYKLNVWYDLEKISNKLYFRKVESSGPDYQYNMAKTILRSFEKGFQP